MIAIVGRSTKCHEFRTERNGQQTKIESPGERGIVTSTVTVRLRAEGEEARDAARKAKIFISYSRKDIAFAGRLEAALTARGIEPLIDRHAIEDLEDWRKRIEALIVQADTIVFVLSPDAVASPECRKEVDFAASLNKRFAPVVCRTVADAAVPDALARIHRIDFVDAPFDDRADRLVKALHTDLDWTSRNSWRARRRRRRAP